LSVKGKIARRAAAVILALATSAFGSLAQAHDAPPAADPFSEAAYAAWLKAEPGRAAAVRDFQRYLISRKVRFVVPIYQILRTASDAPKCQASAFELPPRTLWPNIVPTLRFIADHVEPAIGPVSAVSGYRAPALNACAGGAARSSHVDYSALDLVPLTPTTREQLIARICAAHRAHGRAGRIGLGFYNGVRFHIDSRSFRRWGPDGSSATSPCAPSDPPAA
jgi:hypothetical protein